MNFRKRPSAHTLFFTLFLTCPAMITAQEAADGFAPEIATGIAAAPMVVAEKYMIAAANSYAADAGRNILSAGNRFGTYDLEEGTGSESLQTELEAIGYEVSLRSLTSGLHAIVIDDGKLMGGADPRREGVALGE